MDGEYAQSCWCSIGGRTGHQLGEMFRRDTMRGEERRARSGRHFLTPDPPRRFTQIQTDCSIACS
jgi:hypothetical protein